MHKTIHNVIMIHGSNTIKQKANPHNIIVKFKFELKHTYGYKYAETSFINRATCYIHVCVSCMHAARNKQADLIEAIVQKLYI